MIIIVIPHAGGASMAYFNLKQKIEKEHKWCFFEYKGHGTRAQEPLYVSWSEIVEELYVFVKNSIDNQQDYVLLGNSMGAYLLQELYEKLKINKLMLPIHAIYTACNPYFELENLSVSYIEDNSDSIERIKTLKFYKDYLRPILENDIILLKQVNRKAIFKRKLHCNITVIYGRNDDLITSEYKFDWNKVTSKVCNVKYLEGGHLLLCEKANISEDLQKILKNYIK